MAGGGNQARPDEVSADGGNLSSDTVRHDQERNRH
jgi:hypothetical protein